MDAIKSDHAALLNVLHCMAENPLYAARKVILRDAEALILAQEQRIKELETIINGEAKDAS